MVLFSIFKKSVTVYKDNQEATTLAVSTQMQPRTKHTAIKYHHFWGFFANGEVEIKHVDTKEHIVVIVMNPLDYELFGYLRCKINGW